MMFLKKDIFFCQVKSYHDKFQNGELSTTYPEHLLPAVTMGALGLRKPSFASTSRADVFYDRVEYCVLLLDIGLEEIRPARKVNGIDDYNDMTCAMRKNLVLSSRRSYLVSL